MTKLELNYNYKTSTAEDDVKTGIARKFRELVISVREGGAPFSSSAKEVGFILQQ